MKITTARLAAFRLFEMTLLYHRSEAHHGELKHCNSHWCKNSIGLVDEIQAELAKKRKR